MTDSIGVLPLSLLDDVREAGTKRVLRNHRVSLREICRVNEIEIGDCVTVYFKRYVKKSNAEDCDTAIIEAGLRVIQNQYRVSLRDVLGLCDVQEKDWIVVYIKKTCFKAKKKKELDL